MEAKFDPGALMEDVTHTLKELTARLEAKGAPQATTMSAVAAIAIYTLAEAEAATQGQRATRHRCLHMGRRCAEGSIALMNDVSHKINIPPVH